MTRRWFNAERPSDPSDHFPLSLGFRENTSCFVLELRDLSEKENMLAQCGWLQTCALMVKTPSYWPTQMWWPGKGKECAESFTIYLINTGSMPCRSLQKATDAKVCCSLFILIYSKVGRLTRVFIRHETLSRLLSLSCSFNQKGKIKLSLPCLLRRDVGKESHSRLSKVQSTFTSIGYYEGRTEFCCSFLLIEYSRHLKILVAIKVVIISAWWWW